MYAGLAISNGCIQNIGVWSVCKEKLVFAKNLRKSIIFQMIDFHKFLAKTNFAFHTKQTPIFFNTSVTYGQPCMFSCVYKCIYVTVDFSQQDKIQTNKF